MELLEEDTKENFSDFGFGKSDIKTWTVKKIKKNKLNL
jgi:hypothetical protein